MKGVSVTKAARLRTGDTAAAAPRSGLVTVLSPEAVREALEDLVDLLIERNVKADIVVFGGGALALAYYDRALTNDVDAVFHPETEVLDAATEIARRRGYKAGWFNDGVAQFMPPSGYQPGKTIIERDGVRVRIGSTKFLLALKVRASRPGRDFEDIAVLIRNCGFITPQQVVDLFDNTFNGEEALSTDDHTMICAAFGEVFVKTADPPFTLHAVT